MSKEFIAFLKENKVFSIAIATLLSNGVSNLTDSVIDHMLLPFFNAGVFDTDIDNNRMSDHKQLNNFIVNVFGINIELGKVIISAIKFGLLHFPFTNS